MSGVEEVAKDLVDDEKPPDISISPTNNMGGSWTLLEKEEHEQDEQQKPSCSSELSLPNNDDKIENDETDSESIVTISDEEIMVSQSLGQSVHSSFCYIQGVESDGASSPLEEESHHQECEEGEEGEEEEEEDNPNSQDIDVHSLPAVVENLSSRNLEPGEPGYDLDDDGLPGEPLPPLPQEVELYPSQELDPGYHAIQKEKVYKHYNNLQVDHFLTAILILALALVVGLGIGHFLGKLNLINVFLGVSHEILSKFRNFLFRWLKYSVKLVWSEARPH